MGLIYDTHTDKKKIMIPILETYLYVGFGLEDHSFILGLFCISFWELMREREREREREKERVLEMGGVSDINSGVLKIWV